MLLRRPEDPAHPPRPCTLRANDKAGRLIPSLLKAWNHAYCDSASAHRADEPAHGFLLRQPMVSRAAPSSVGDSAGMSDAHRQPPPDTRPGLCRNKAWGATAGRSSSIRPAPKSSCSLPDEASAVAGIRRLSAVAADDSGGCRRLQRRKGGRAGQALTASTPCMADASYACGRPPDGWAAKARETRIMRLVAGQ